MNSETFCRSIVPWFCCPEEIHLCEDSTTPVPMAIIEEVNLEGKIFYLHNLVS